MTRSVGNCGNHRWTERSWRHKYLDDDDRWVEFELHLCDNQGCLQRNIVYEGPLRSLDDARPLTHCPGHPSGQHRWPGLMLSRDLEDRVVEFRRCARGGCRETWTTKIRFKNPPPPGRGLDSVAAGPTRTRRSATEFSPRRLEGVREGTIL